MARNNKDAVRSLLTCAKCNRELRLFGIESESTARDLYTYECTNCGGLEVRGISVK
jgi:DNA-directed RNA polymerase subunit RPC12/RpoP